MQTLDEYVLGRFVIIDNATEKVCWVGSAKSAQSACDIADRETGLIEIGQYTYESRTSLAKCEPGYVVHYAPEGFNIEEQGACAAVIAWPTAAAAGVFARLN